ncbi:MAG TPA: type II CAAX endopeptidase family protein [Myxococcota bacterium]|nr:type II CAAX endopeptidase family protein [Myxococcota bacterium]
MARVVRALALFALGTLAFAMAAASGMDEPATLARNAAATALGLVAWAFAGATLSGQPFAPRLGWLPSRLPPGVFVGLVFGMLALSQLAEWLIAFAGYEQVGNLPEFRRVLGEARGPSLGAALVGVALLPGIAEELALRGFVQRGLHARFGAVVAVIVSSLLFALLHGEPVHAAGALLLGLYLGTIVALCGSIRPAMVCHVVNNAVATLGTAWALPWLGESAALLGAAIGPWALWRTALQARAAHAPLGGSTEPAAPPRPR